ncbi:MAG: pyruvate, water dikinase [Desulfamplus sp.]|nr:pyruvate, water dikinase [Desulfamplus sp.]
MGLIDRLRQWLGIKEAEETPEERQKTEELRDQFKERYHNFKVLLAANQKSLEAMAEIEHALFGNKPFSMTFVKSKCTDVAVNVLRMILNLEHLAPQKYDLLSPIFFQIRKSIDDILMEKRPFLPRDIVASLQNRNIPPDLVGSKMASLSEMGGCCNVDIPQGFVITSYAYDLFVQAGKGRRKEEALQTEINRLMQTCDFDDMESMHAISAKIRQMIIQAKIPDEVVSQIEIAWQNLDSQIKLENSTKDRSPIRVALRSSAIGEDSMNSSFAGQYHSELNVSKDSIFESYKMVIASKYTLHAMMYRINKGFKDEDVPMAVGCVQMVDAAVGGVIYSANPVDMSDNSIWINAVFGLPKAVVDGSVPSDLFIVSRFDFKIVKEEIAIKDKKFVCYPEEGIVRMEIEPSQRTIPTISKDQVIELSKIALRLETHFGSAQDIEWAIDNNGKIIILQSRPLQQNRLSDFDSSNRETSPSTIEDFLKKYPFDEKDLIAKEGVAASSGVASGEAFVALKHVDILKFQPCSVLVIRQALPEWATVVGQASAILSEQGSAASHLASVAREFRVPAIFGIKGITSAIKSGEPITVNADIPAVWRGLLHTSEIDKSTCSTKNNPMKGSPVYSTLERCSRHIVPLGLLDPDSSDFKPDNCKTLHDITRFIHEKSVSEMFSFGKNHNFPEKSSKQLHYKVPMQWYILDLDNGFAKPIKGKYVKLEEIASIPMVAFWEGFVAIQWEGPPPMDGKGMMSVMFHSTANTALTTGIKSAYAQHNYFMISKNYTDILITSENPYNILIA